MVYGEYESSVESALVSRLLVELFAEREKEASVELFDSGSIGVEFLPMLYGRYESSVELVLLEKLMVELPGEAGNEASVESYDSRSIDVELSIVVTESKLCSTSSPPCTSLSVSGETVWFLLTRANLFVM